MNSGFTFYTPPNQGCFSKYALLRSLTCLLSLLLLAACQSSVSSEQKLVQSLPSNPNVTSAALSPSTQQPVTQGDPRFRPVRSNTPLAIVVPTGSLFSEVSYSGLFLHKRIYKHGDMIQVNLEEQINATKQQSLNQDKDSKIDLEPEVTAGFIHIDNTDLNVKHRQSSSFNSSSDSQQSNSLDGVVNVFVNEILANGNLIVSGEKWIKLNEGVEYIRVYGEVRVSDITADNIVSSTKLGNALIEYSGNGPLQENQDTPLVSKILSVFQ